MSARDDLHRLADELPTELADEVVNFAEFLRDKHALQRSAGVPCEEDRAWLDADMSRMGDVEPYDWGPEGVPPGKPVVWDEARQTFVIVGGRDEPA